MTRDAARRIAANIAKLPLASSCCGRHANGSAKRVRIDLPSHYTQKDCRVVSNSGRRGCSSAAIFLHNTPAG
jgi:hypothetical protein